MADGSGGDDEVKRTAAPGGATWHADRPSFIDDDECRLALEELLQEAGVVPSRRRSRPAPP